MRCTSDTAHQHTWLARSNTTAPYRPAIPATAANAVRLTLLSDTGHLPDGLDRVVGARTTPALQQSHAFEQQ